VCSNSVPCALVWVVKMIKKITKKAMEVWMRHKLSTDKVWAERALYILYDCQTEEEKAIVDTAVNNGVGFTGSDGNLLSSMVKSMNLKRKVNPHYRFSNNQFNKILFHKMPRYWKQIYGMANIDKLESRYRNDPFNIQTELKLEVE